MTAFEPKPAFRRRAAVFARACAASVLVLGQLAAAPALATTVPPGPPGGPGIPPGPIGGPPTPSVAAQRAQVPEGSGNEGDETGRATIQPASSVAGDQKKPAPRILRYLRDGETSSDPNLVVR